MTSGSRTAWVLLVLLLAGCGAAEKGTLVLDRAELALGRSDVPPDAGWRNVELPDRWGLARRREANDGWYRIRFEGAPVAEGRLALWLPRVFPNAEVFLNGDRVGSGGRLSHPPARNRYRALFLPLRDGLLRRDGDNELLLRFVGTPGSVGSVHPVWLGSEEVIRSRHEAWTLLSVNLGQIAVVLAVLLALVAAQQALAGEGAAGQGWYAAGLLAVAGTSLGLFTADAELPSRFVVAFVTICTHFAVLAFAIGVARAAGSKRRAERYWIAGYGATAVVVALLPELYVPAVFVLWWGPSLLLGGGIVFRLWKLAVLRGRRGFLAGLAAVAAAVATLVGSALTARDAQLPGDVGGLVLPWMLILIFGALILGQIRTALRTTRLANQELEMRVAARERELGERYERLRELEGDRARDEERRRIARDMHDGTGGLLASALARLRSGRATPESLERSLEDALLDMRLTIGSAHARAIDLPGLLGLLRERIEREARQHGLALEWGVTDAGEDRDLQPDVVLHVIRFVQEAVANAVRHSQGHTLRLRSDWVESLDPRRLQIEISDDGRGGASEQTAGHGLAHFRERARLIGGQVELRSDDAGTCVRLRFPPDSVVGSDEAEL